MVSLEPSFPCFVLTRLLVALEKSTGGDDKSESSEDNTQTIRPTKSPAGKVTPLARAPTTEPIVEDYSDLASEEDEDWLEEKVADFKVPKSLHVPTGSGTYCGSS